MLEKRASGVVLHVSSLPNAYGIGSLGAGARTFIDFLQKAGQRYWQILPLSPTGFGDSPYQSCSTRAGNPYFIDLDLLVETGMLEQGEADAVRRPPDHVDYDALYQTRLPLLRAAFARGREKLAGELAAFRRAQADWLPDYALFMAIKARFGMLPLSEWPDKDLLAREPKAMRSARTELCDECAFYEFMQYLFFTQWTQLRDYAREKGILIIGDVPIYVSEDSVEVWAESRLFLLSGPGRPSVVAGVPPDLYSETGQLWGNPLYNWKVHELDGFAWWIDRIRHTRTLCDVVRIDHFRGFHTYWEVGAGEDTALGGCWRKGPGLKLVRALKAAFPKLDIIAEDLGDLDEAAWSFIGKSGLPGMSVLIYGFDPEGESLYLPHKIPPFRVAYTSTHDAPTFVEWLTDEANEAEREFAGEYMRLRVEEGLAWGAVKSVWGCPAGLAMAPLQDILGLGADARMNKPSTLGGLNWRWRVREEALNDEVAQRLRRITQVYRRLPDK